MQIIGDNSEIICIPAINVEGSDTRKLMTVEIKKKMLVAHSQEKKENVEMFNADDVWYSLRYSLRQLLPYRELEGYLWMSFGVKQKNTQIFSTK